eukprot:scaffold94411_cov47-Attheya_sp.AAC.1
MLPDDVWESYYDRPCEICEETIHWRDEDHGMCSICHKTMCEECRYNCECHVCNEKGDDEGDNYDDDWDSTNNVCNNCIKGCKTCKVKFYPGKCKEEHKKKCNSKGRAERACVSAKKAVSDKEGEIERTKRQLATMEDELKTARKSKTKACRDLEQV